jgi:hypothetical protein
VGYFWAVPAADTAHKLWWPYWNSLEREKEAALIVVLTDHGRQEND